MLKVQFKRLNDPLFAALKLWFTICPKVELNGKNIHLNVKRFLREVKKFKGKKETIWSSKRNTDFQQPCAFDRVPEQEVPDLRVNSFGHAASQREASRVL